jgi:hydrogenase maturation protein HypF
MSAEAAGLRLLCRGVVQGVGFRPWVHRLATELELDGDLSNGAEGVEVELSGPRPQLQCFLRRLAAELPAPARLEPLLPQWGAVTAARGQGVRIGAGPRQSLGEGWLAPGLAPDRAPCADCLAELADPTSRRRGDPFISCARCGPRFSIALAHPYRRAHTTLAGFVPCEVCRREFADPGDRRFHAETIGCPRCGPRLQLWDGEVRVGEEQAADRQPDRPSAPLARACELLAAGRILALQGVGGFQLLVDAGNAEAVARLRRRKRRPARPFALLVADEAWLAAAVWIDPAERAALRDGAAPIVLLRRRPAALEAWPGVAPGSPALGVMRPASPLHHLLVQRFGRPLVATSGNRSGEPLCIDPLEARQRLAGIADAFLVHDLPIARPLDDSLLQVIEGRPVLLRRARGYAPEPLALPASAASRPASDPSRPAAGLTLLALSGDLKCAPALALGDRLWLAPHLGDLADRRCQERLQRGMAELSQRLGSAAGGAAPLPAPAAAPLTLICDAHPGYVSHQLAHASGLPLGTVQHHLAHGLAVMAEHGLEPPLLVAALDGLGYGGPLTTVAAADGSGQADAISHCLWGGELLLIDRARHAGPWRAEHLAGLRPFPLPGGERAMVEPRRAALGLLLAADALDHPGAWRVRQAFAPADLELLRQAVAAGCQAPLCSSAGRLFDGVASLLGLVQVLGYEGEGGLRLQGAAARELAGGEPGGEWPVAEGWTGVSPLPLLAPGGGAGWRLDWGPLLLQVLDGVAAGTPPERLAARFHRQLAEGLASALAAWADRLDLAADGRRVALAGGCFQNRLLLEATSAGLRRRGLQPWWSERLPGNDGGLALGQAWAGRLGLAITPL